jgi:hypothetical protein
MSSFPPSTVRVTGIEPHGEGKVRIHMELVVDVHRLAEVSGDLMQTAVKQMKNQGAGARKKK